MARMSNICGAIKADKVEIKKELKSIVSIAWPVVISYLGSMILSTVTLLFVGRISETALAGASLGMMYTNVMGRSIIIGLTSGQETLASQSYGARRYKNVGIITQRGFLIGLAACVPIAALWFSCEYVLVLAGQMPVLAKKAGEYSVYLLPTLIPFTAYQSSIKYLQIQGRTLPFIVSAFTGAAACAGANALFVVYLDMEVKGAALATCVGDTVGFLSVLSIIFIRKMHKKPHMTWGGWTKDAFKGWPAYLRLGLSGAAMICLEWWCFEVATLLAGLLPEDTEAGVDAQTIGFNTIALVFMIPLSVGVAASARVGNHLGSGDGISGRRAAFISLFLIFCIELVMIGAVLAVKDVWAYLYTDSETVADITRSLFPIIASFILFDGWQGTASGILRGMGKQRWGAIINAIAYYVLALPLGVLLTFGPPNMGIFGLWIGLVAGNIAQCVCFTLIIVRTKWQKEAGAAVKRAEEEAGRVEAGSSEEEGGGAELILAERDGEDEEKGKRKEGEVEMSKMGGDNDEEERARIEEEEEEEEEEEGRRTDARPLLSSL